MCRGRTALLIAISPRFRGRALTRAVFVVLALTVGSLFGCGSTGGAGSGPTDGVNGTVQGAAFHVQGAVFVETNASGLDFDGMSTDILVTSFDNSCDQATSEQSVRNSALLFLGLGITDGSGHTNPAHEAGDYKVSRYPLPSNSKIAEVFYEMHGSKCETVHQDQANDGIVTLTTTNPGRIDASANLEFGSGDRLKGDFSAAPCAGFDPNHSPTSCK